MQMWNEVHQEGFLEGVSFEPCFVAGLRWGQRDFLGLKCQHHTAERWGGGSSCHSTEQLFLEQSHMGSGNTAPTMLAAAIQVKAEVGGVARSRQGRCHSSIKHQQEFYSSSWPDEEGRSM